MNARPALNIQVTSYGEGADYRSAMWMGPEPRPGRSSPYRLRLEWPTGLAGHGRGTICWVGLNPSTADERDLDPTLRRVQRFSREWGFSRFVMLNLWPYRATDPTDLWRRLAEEAESGMMRRIVEVTLLQVRAELNVASGVVFGWGAFSKCPRAMLHHAGRMAQFVVGQAEKNPRVEQGRLHVAHLGRTKQGRPKHPLYLPANTAPQCVFTDEIVEWRS